MCEKCIITIYKTNIEFGAIYRIFNVYIYTDNVLGHFVGGHDSSDLPWLGELRWDVDVVSV